MAYTLRDTAGAIELCDNGRAIKRYGIECYGYDLATARRAAQEAIDGLGELTRARRAATGEPTGAPQAAEPVAESEPTAEPTAELSRVVNLATGSESFYSLPSDRAVIAAYAQSRGDYNWWDYPARYTDLLQTTRSGLHHTIGDFACRCSATIGESAESIAARISASR